MTKKGTIKIFEEKKVRTLWDDKQKKIVFLRNGCGRHTDRPTGHRACS